jgi:hypothetical protein
MWWEVVREWSLSIQFEGRPLIGRATLATWCTVLLVISVATVLLLNAPAPDIVYKAF